MARVPEEKGSRRGRRLVPRDEFERNMLFGQVLIAAIGVLTIVAILTIGA